LAGIRYQNTHKGRLKHAARQHCYRQRQQQKIKIVTHQGLPKNSNHDLLQTRIDGAKTRVKAVLLNDLYCHFCNNKVSIFLRRGFLERANHLFVNAKTALGQGP
jgi:radical SAM superfamily enzyme